MGVTGSVSPFRSIYREAKQDAAERASRGDGSFVAFVLNVPVCPVGWMQIQRSGSNVGGEVMVRGGIQSTQQAIDIG
jgi:hypothetical protein